MHNLGAHFNQTYNLSDIELENISFYFSIHCVYLIIQQREVRNTGLGQTKIHFLEEKQQGKK